MSTANMDTNKTSGNDNPDHARLKKVKSHQHSQDLGHVQGGHGPPSKDIGTMYYDRKFFDIIFILG